MKAISFIVITKDSSGTLRRCLSSIEGSFLPGDELILVLNNSDDATRKIATEFQKKWRILIESQAGPAFARNSGAASARNELLFFLDSDVLLMPGWRNYIEEQFARPWTVAGQIKLKHEKSTRLISRIKRISAQNSITRFYRLKKIRQLINIHTLHLDTANMITRKSWFDKMGHFDVSYRYHEDTAFSLKTLQEGGDIFFEDRTFNLEANDPNESLLDFFSKQFPQAQYFPKLAREFSIDLMLSPSILIFNPFPLKNVFTTFLRLICRLVQYAGLASSPFPIILHHTHSPRNSKNMKKYYLTGQNPLVRSVWIGDKERLFDIRQRSWLSENDQ